MRIRVFLGIFLSIFLIMIFYQSFCFYFIEDVILKSDLTNENIYLFMLLFLSFMIIAFFLALVLSKKIIKPLEKINLNNIEEIKKIKELKNLLNEVAEQNRQFKKIQNEFSTNVTHELKTPLTSIMLSSEMLKNKLVKKEDEDKFITTIYEQSNNLLIMIDDIIKLSFLDEKNHFDLSNINLKNIIENIIKELEFKIGNRKLKLELNLQDAKIFANEQLVKTMIFNIIDNAIKYNIDNGYIKIIMLIKKKSIHLSIKDSGIGIEKKSQDRIFDRFYQNNKENKGIKGAGLGLSIVKKIAKIHKIKIILNSEINCGTEFIFMFKKSRY